MSDFSSLQPSAVRQDNVPVVVTSFVYPPIPVRSFDWCAYFDGEEERGEYGWGEDEEAARADLLTNWGPEE